MRPGVCIVGARSAYFFRLRFGMRSAYIDGMNTPAIKAADLQRIGVSKPYAHQIVRGEGPSVSMALRIFRELGAKFGPIASLSDDEIAVLEKMHG
jgi:hypothetical protein